MMCAVDWAVVAAWVQAIGSVAAIGVAIWLPRRDRDIREKQEHKFQKSTLLVIAERCLETVRMLHERARTGSILRGEYAWLRDEQGAVRSIADRVDLTIIKDTSLTLAFFQVQEACRTALRRLNDIDIDKTKSGANIPVPTNRFEDPFDRLTKAIDVLKKATYGERLETPVTKFPPAPADNN